jgi:hypothetical protein
VDNEFVAPLEKGKSEITKIKVKKFSGNIYVDIRKFYDEGSKPTPKGISLRPELFEKLIFLRPVIEQSVDLVEKTRDSLAPEHAGRASVMRDGSEVKVSIELDKSIQIGVSRFKNMTLIDVRSFYNGAPTKKGVSLKPDMFRAVVEWDQWKEAVAKLR